MKRKIKIFFIVELFVFSFLSSVCDAQPYYPYSSPPQPGYRMPRGYALQPGYAMSPNVQTVSVSNSEQPWTQEMIKKEDRSFDFKTVAKGVRAEHRFILKNPFSDNVHIASVTSSCSCTTPYVLDGKDEIQTYEKTAIIAWFRTDLYEGPKNATITVVIDRPYRAEFQLNVRGEIRSDITIEPNIVKLDNVKEGEEVSRTLNIAYQGFNPTWKIVDFKSENEHISGQLLEMQPTPGRITAKVKIILDAQAPSGKFSDRLFLLTNDPGSRREIPVIVQGTVGTVITVTPETLFLGYLKPGEASPVKNVNLRGSQPFRIKNIQCDNPKVEIKFEPKEDAPQKILYLLPIHYTNPVDGEGAPIDGKMKAQVKIETDQPGLTPTFNITMVIPVEEKAEEKIEEKAEEKLEEKEASKE